VSVITGARLRRLIPVSVVAAVLAIAYTSPLPADASKLNNCGVKAGYGYAYHDHGKPCPNRPFPGHGIGALRQLGISLTSSESGSSATPQTKSKVKSETGETDSAVLTDEADSSTGFAHGRGHSKSHGNGHANGHG